MSRERTILNADGTVTVVPEVRRPTAIGTSSYGYRPAGQLGAGAVDTIDGPLANDTLTYTYDELGRIAS